MRNVLSTLHARDYHAGVNPYAILGVADGADEETIRFVYRQLARTFHPDVNADPDAVEHFRAITEAYVLLTDPEKRAEYDRRQGDRPVGSETRTTLGLHLAGIDLAPLLGISVRVRTRPLFTDDLEEEERPQPRALRTRRK
jgi:curved DNA-binding protein CbpA